MMNAAPNPGKLPELIHALDQGLADQRGPAELLEIALPPLQAIWPAILHLHFFEGAEGGDLHLIHSSNTDALQNIASEDTLIHQGLVCVRLSESILLAAQVEDAQADSRAWLRLLVEPLGEALRQAERQQMEVALGRVLAGINAQQSQDAVLRLIHDELFGGQVNTVQLSLLHVQHDFEDQVTGLGLAASTWERPFDWHRPPPALQRVIDRQRLSILQTDDAQGTEVLGTALYAWLKVHNIQQVAIWPLILEGSTAGLLLVEFWHSESLTDSLRLSIDRLAQHLSMLFYVRQFRDEAQSTRMIADNLVQSSRMIATASSYNEMAQAAADTIARHMAGVALTFFDQALDAEVRPTGRALVALAVPSGPVAGAQSPYSPLLPDNQKLDYLWRGQPVVLEGDPGRGFGLVPEIYQRLVGGEPVKWLAAFGLRAGGQVLGTLEILHHSQHPLSSIEVDAFNTLADQIGVAVRNRQLLEQSDETLEETRLLHEMSQQLIVAQDTADLLRALRLIAPDAAQILHSSLEYDPESGLLVDMIAQHILKSERVQTIRQSVVATLGTQGPLRLAVLVDDLNDLRFIEDTGMLSDDERKLILGEEPDDLAGSAVLVPISEPGPPARSDPGGLSSTACLR